MLCLSIYIAKTYQYSSSFFFLIKVNGIAKSKEILAIMGASGAGKTIE
jgi:ABC-type multidrug transport system ATPase subunit